MIRYILPVLLLFTACRPQSDNTVALQTTIDSLRRQINNAYRPGLGEFMSEIQVHHEKLWFAGQARNWRLADFEAGEIKESLDDIEKYCRDRPEVQSLPMIRPAIDSMNAAIQARSVASFNNSFTLLTNTCNNCHRATKHEFNVITIPTTPPFSNQAFNLQ